MSLSQGFSFSRKGRLLGAARLSLASEKPPKAAWEEHGKALMFLSKERSKAKGAFQVFKRGVAPGTDQGNLFPAQFVSPAIGRGQ